jgi:6-pyruvoyltetrahydropterin/6-carboxytetrahydropterin synthase
MVLHGYSRSFHFTFGAKERDLCGFVVDFGALHWLKDRLDSYFDHTLLLCADDPLLPEFQELEAQGAARIVILPYGVGMEDTAQAIGEWADTELRTKTKGRAWVNTLEVAENEKNSGIWTNPEAGFKGWL